MRDLFSEIIASISHSKTRFLLTGLSTAWGIFLLIVLLGTGNGILISIHQNCFPGATKTTMS